MSSSDLDGPELRVSNADGFASSKQSDFDICSDQMSSKSVDPIETCSETWTHKRRLYRQAFKQFALLSKGYIPFDQFGDGRPSEIETNASKRTWTLWNLRY